MTFLNSQIYLNLYELQFFYINTYINHRSGVWSSNGKPHVLATEGDTHTVLRLYIRQILTDFQDSLTDTLSSKFAMKPSLKIPPHLEHVAIHYLMKYYFYLTTSCVVHIVLGSNSGFGFLLEV